jgi:hypothetical protein
VVDEIELIRELRANFPAPRAQSRESSRAALLKRIENIEASSQVSGRKPRIHARRLLAAAVCTVVLLAAISIAVLGVEGSGVQSAAAKVLQRVADVAASQLPPKTPRAGEYLFTRSKEAHLELSFRESPVVGARIRRRFMQVRHTHGGVKEPTWWYFEPQDREMWFAANGFGWRKEISGKASFLSARQQAAWIAAGSPPLPRAGRVTTGGFNKHGLAGLYFSQLSQLPTDAPILRKWIEDHKVPGKVLATAGTTSSGLPPLKAGYAPIFGAVGFLLGETFARPQLRARSIGSPQNCPAFSCSAASQTPLGVTGSVSHIPTPRTVSDWS